jgi:CBS domain-containing protein
MTEKTTNTETEVSGDDLVAKVKEILHEGNVRRIVIKNEEGERVIEIPLTVGVVGALLLPSLAAIGTVAALLSKCTLEVEREEE